MTIVIVAHPRTRREIRHCLDSFRAWYRGDDLRWVILTEAENIDAMRAIAGDAAEAQAMAPEAEAIRQPYYRQQAAKMYAFTATDDTELVITDDDTEAIGHWSRETFFDQGRARIWYRRHPLAFWLPGQRWVFPGHVERDYQLRLPFSIRRETLAALASSVYGIRAMAAWHRAELVSEFMVMGEFAARHDAERAVFLDADRDRGHWTIGERPRFRDWQAFRTALRRRIAKGQPR